MKYQMHIVAAVIVLLTMAVGCSKKGDESASAEKSKPPVAVETALVRSAELVEGIEVTGSLSPKFAAEVKSEIPGLIREVYVTEWVQVRKGTPLARIDVAETEAQVKQAEATMESAKAGLAEAKAQGSRAERELARALELKAAGLAPQQQIDDARTLAEASGARIEAAKAQIRAAEEEVRQARVRSAKGAINSPMDGVVALRDVNVGDLANDSGTAKSLFRIVDNRILNLTVTVPSTESARVQKGQTLEFTVDAHPGMVFAGEVMFMNPEFASDDRSLKVIAEVHNDRELLKGGLFAKGRIIIDRRPGSLQVARSALAGWNMATRQASLFVLIGDSARSRRVETGALNNDQVEILSGLAEGEQYVLRGGFTLTDGDKVAVQKKQ